MIVAGGITNVAIEDKSSQVSYRVTCHCLGYEEGTTLIRRR